MHTEGLLSISLFVATSFATSTDSIRYDWRATHQPTVWFPNDGIIFLGTSSSASTESFLNIRFGADTSGQNRFAPPVPYSYAPNTVVNASRPGAACPQREVPLPGVSLLDNVTNISEDCLSLRVDRLAGTTKDAKLPVLVWIYGGGDTIGQIYDAAYNPSDLLSNAKEQGYPVVYAAMNYRLSIFGFAASEALSFADSLNAGLRDQRLGIEWIKKNIAAFGGDPDRITIFGESDGATGVGLQLTAYGGDRPASFHRVIMESGGPTADAKVASNFSAVNTAAVVKLTNCAAPSSEEELECLRRLPMKTLFDITMQYEVSVSPPRGLDIFIPTAPSPFIPDSPSNLLRAGRFAKDIDIIGGWTENDASEFTPTTVGSDNDVESALSQILFLSQDSIEKVKILYPLSEFQADTKANISGQYFRLSQILRDAEFSCPVMLVVDSNRKYSDCNTNNYLYAFNQTMFANNLVSKNASFMGVPHFSEVPYVFNQAGTRFKEVATDFDRRLAKAVSATWAAFAAEGKITQRQGAVGQTGGTVLDWTGSRCGDEAASVRILGGPNPELRTVDMYEGLAKRCEFWNSPRVTNEMQV